MVEDELGKARLRIEQSMVPQGEKVERHLSLPPQGHTPEWIARAMDIMDAEAAHKSDWREGKVSGAVYRMSTQILLFDDNMLTF